MRQEMTEDKILAVLRDGCSIAKANESLLHSKDSYHVVALPSDFKYHDLEKSAPCRRRARGKMCTNEVGHFAKYATTHALPGASVFVEGSNILRAQAVLNMGTNETPGHADNVAVLELTPTADWNALRDIQGRPITQRDFAEFLQDWAEQIECFDTDGDQIPSARAIAAVGKVTVQSISRRESKEQALSQSRSTFEDVTASSQEPLPVLVSFTCKPYADLETREFFMRVGVTENDEGKLRFRLRPIRKEQHDQEMAEELMQKLREAFGEEKSPIMIYKGTYKSAE